MALETFEGSAVSYETQHITMGSDCVSEVSWPHTAVAAPRSFSMFLKCKAQPAAHSCEIRSLSNSTASHVVANTCQTFFRQHGWKLTMAIRAWLRSLLQGKEMAQRQLYFF